MNEDKNKTAPNPLSDWLDDKLIIVGLNEQNTKEKGGETA